jgi:hypothetical protein
MEKELLEMAQLWKKTAREELAKSEPASRSEFANQMLLACAEMLEWKFVGCKKDSLEFPRPSVSKVT